MVTFQFHIASANTEAVLLFKINSINNEKVFFLRKRLSKISQIIMVILQKINWCYSTTILTFLMKVFSKLSLL